MDFLLRILERHGKILSNKGTGLGAYFRKISQAFPGGWVKSDGTGSWSPGRRPGGDLRGRNRVRPGRAWGEKEEDLKHRDAKSSFPLFQTSAPSLPSSVLQPWAFNRVSQCKDPSRYPVGVGMWFCLGLWEAPPPPPSATPQGRSC